jgi:hypothetical protein
VDTFKTVVLIQIQLSEFKFDDDGAWELVNRTNDLNLKSAAFSESWSVCNSRRACSLRAA